MEISPLVPEKKIYEGVLTIYGNGGHLGHVANIMLTNFHFIVPKSLVKNGPVVSEKGKF